MRDTVVVNGRQIGPDTDITELLRRQLKSGTALGQEMDEGPEAAVFGLFTAARGTSLEHRLVQSAMDLLMDPDVQVRSGIVDVIQQFPNLFDAARLVRALDSNPQMFRNVSNNPSKPNLEIGLLRAAAANPSRDPSVISRLRGAASDPQTGQWVLAGVARNDSEWVLENLSAVVNGDLQRAKIVVFRLKDSPLLERLVRLVPRESPRLRNLIAAAIATEVKDPKESQHLLDLLK